MSWKDRRGLDSREGLGRSELCQVNALLLPEPLKHFVGKPLAVNRLSLMRTGRLYLGCSRQYVNKRA